MKEIVKVPRSWRELLGAIISDPLERQRVADALNINPITLSRWASGKSSPREDRFHPLLDALPHHRKQMSELIPLEFPQFSATASPLHIEIYSIPSEFYALVINAHVSSPVQLRSSAIISLILQQILSHFDPLKSGLIAMLLTCVPPTQGSKVRSLRVVATRSTPAWQEGVYMESWTLFAGIEAMAGRAVVTGYPCIVQTLDEKRVLFPSHLLNNEESSVAIPLLLSDQIAGVLYVTSMQRNRFSQENLTLLQEYANLLVMAFDPSDFFPLNEIELGIMPPFFTQMSYLTRFQKRVALKIVQATKDHRVLNRQQAESEVWQEIEQELLVLGIANDFTQTPPQIIR